MNHTSLSVDNIVLLPSYAQYILENKLQEYVDMQIKLAEELQVPLLNVIKRISNEELRNILLQTSVELLTSLVRNEANRYIESSVNRWQVNQLPQIDQNEITAEDITLIIFIRKRTFLHFIPGYSQNVDHILALVNEISLFFTKCTAAFSQTYIDLFQKKLEEQTNFLTRNEQQLREAQEIAQLGSYTWDIKNGRSELSPQASKIFEIKAGDREGFMSKIHPGDRKRVEEETKIAFEKTGSFNSEYRYLGKEKEKILWARGIITYEDGKPVAVHGTVMDVTSSQLLLQKLQRSEALYRQAEMLAKVGNWSWDLVSGKVEWTDQLYSIYGLQPQSEEVNFEKFLTMVHPEDREVVIGSLQKQFKNRNNRDFKFRIITNTGEVKTIHSVSQLFSDAQGKPLYIIGTDQDVTQQENLLDQLRISNKLHELAQALSHVGHFVYDYKSRKAEITSEIGRIYELAPEKKQITLEEIRSYRHPDDQKQIDEALKASGKSGQDVDIQYRIVVHDKVKTVHLRGEIVVNGAGLSERLIGTIQDITQQKLFEQQLQEKQNFVQKIADATPSVIIAFNIITGEILFVNAGFKSILGYEINRLQKEGASFLWQIIHPDDLEEMKDKSIQAIMEATRISKAENENKVIEFKFRVLHKSGKVLWMQSYSTVFSKNSRGRIESLINISYDITESVNAGQRLAEQEHFIQQVADASPTVLYLYDVEEDSFIYINKEIYFILEYTVEEALEMKGQVVAQLYHPADVSVLPERTGSPAMFQHNSSMIQFECRMKKKSGDWCWMLVREVVFKTGAEGKPVQILGAALDINRRKEVERDLVQKTLQLKQSNSSLEEFAYTASHDLKEPLRKISTFGDRLLAMQQSSAKPDEQIFLKKIVDASQRMQTMINDILSISMISGNKSFEDYSLKTILNETLQTLEYKIEQKDVIITVDDLPEAHIIPAQFRQLFQNLISNSLKFMREGVQPHITIRHAYLKPDEVGEFSLQPAGQYLKIEFEDNGIGFENEYSGKIFQIFQRLHGRSEYEGSGIGLAICKKIVEHHGGVIFATGYPGKGAIFTIILPA